MTWEELCKSGRVYGSVSRDVIFNGDYYTSKILAAILKKEDFCIRNNDPKIIVKYFPKFKLPGEFLI